MRKVRKGDTVRVLNGKSRGKEGAVLRVFPKEGKILVEGVNVIKKHKKRTANQKDPGGIVETEGKIDISNVLVMDTEKGKASRVGFSNTKSGKKVRILKKTTSEI